MSFRKADSKTKLRVASAHEWARLLTQYQGDFALSQTFEFGAALARAYPEYTHEPQIAEFENGARVLIPLIRVQSRLFRVFEAMPLSLNGTPLGIKATPHQIGIALDAIEADRLAVNGGVRSGSESDFLSAMTRDEGETHVLDLDVGFNELWTKKFGSKVRNQCRAAQKRGVETFEATCVEEFDAYYEIYVESSQRWGYTAPPYPRALFQELSTLRRQDNQKSGVQLKLARVEDKIVAGVLLFHGRHSVLYWSGAMRREFAAFSPNNALLEVVIREACEIGHSVFDFGASGPLDSVRKFKESFGARLASFSNFSRQGVRYSVAQVALERLKRPSRPRIAEVKS